MFRYTWQYWLFRLGVYGKVTRLWLQQWWWRLLAETLRWWQWQFRHTPLGQPLLSAYFGAARRAYPHRFRATAAR